MKLYRGFREGTCKVTVTDGEGKSYDLPPRLDLKTHAPDGAFEWGYRGGGPSQLALALVADVIKDKDGKCDDAYALSIYAQVRDMLICRLPLNEWTLSEPEIREFC